MKNTILDAIRNGQETSTEELFRLVNDYDFTDLVVQDENYVAILKITINHFEKYGNAYEFSQLHSDSGMYIIKRPDIISAEPDYHEDIDTLFIKCHISDGKMMHLVIYHASANFKTTESNEYSETDLGDLQNFLENTLGDDAEYHCALAKITNKNGMNIKITSPERTYIDTMDDSDWKLHIGDALTVIEVPVTDDDCNAFYRKEKDNAVTILIKPYELPFTDIMMLFVK